MMRHPPTFDPVKREKCQTEPHNKNILKSLTTSVRKSHSPGAVAHEDALPYSQRAVIPHQQKVEDFISDSGKRRERNYEGIS